MAKRKKSKPASRRLPQTWRTGTGETLLLKDMDVSHLINTFHFIKRKAADEYILYPEAHTVSVDKFCSHIYPVYESIRQEIANRLRAMPKDSIERKFWHSKFSRDAKGDRVFSSFPPDQSEPDDDGQRW